MSRPYQIGDHPDDYEIRTGRTTRPLGNVHLFLNGARGHAVLARIKDRFDVSNVYEGGFDPNTPESLARIRSGNPDVIILAGFPRIVGREFLSLCQVINLHAGRLPQYRGGSPLNWQIINGEKVAGLSIIRVDEGIDTGPVLAEAEIPIGPDDTIADLHQRANEVFPEMVVDVLDRMATDELRPRPQGVGTYWHQRRESDGLIDWSRRAEDVHNFVRAITRPYPGAFTWRDGKKVRIWKTRLTPAAIRGVPGRFCRIQGATYAVCGDRALEVAEQEVASA
jgi:methionyl-tRNA formyltransferase